MKWQTYVVTVQSILKQFNTYLQPPFPSIIHNVIHMRGASIISVTIIELNGKEITGTKIINLTKIQIKY